MPAVRKHNHPPIGVIDIFAGPGGLGEGFSRFQTTASGQPFDVIASAEMDGAARETLRLRAFTRLAARQEPRALHDYYTFLGLVARGVLADPSAYFGDGKWSALWGQAGDRAMHLTLGREDHNRQLYERIRAVRDSYSEMILVGGPPCQAYSLVGRARQRNVKGFRTKGVPKHFLYLQYLRILADFQPAVFIMENVRGILTSQVGGDRMFPTIVADLSDPASSLDLGPHHKRPKYTLLPMHIMPGNERSAEDVSLHPDAFVIRCEDHGVPQARHRVIIMGVRSDLAVPALSQTLGLPMFASETVEQRIGCLPKLRSGLSRTVDDAEQWRRTVCVQRDRVVRAARARYPEVAEILRALEPGFTLPRRATQSGDSEVVRKVRSVSHHHLPILNHETRGHMPADLGRYLFCAAFGEAYGKSPIQSEFPSALAPDHLNWDTGAFADRFRVQLPGHPSSTITSHLSKDGHAFIHWDPTQCRSLTVREAARLQTFPDDYLFLGNRTQQYVQVGNAVPPLIAKQIAGVVWRVLGGV